MNSIRLLASSQKSVTPAVAVGVLCLYSLSNGETVHAKAATIDNNETKNIKKAIEDVIEADSAKRGDGTSLTGTFVRLAWHCAGTYSKIDGSGGSNGARMRFTPEQTWGANAGLDVARDALEPVKVRLYSYSLCAILILFN